MAEGDIEEDWMCADLVPTSREVRIAGWMCSCCGVVKHLDEWWRVETNLSWNPFTQWCCSELCKEATMVRLAVEGKTR